MSTKRPNAVLTAQKQRGAPFKPGADWKGNAAGRPRGSRNRISEAFVAAFAADFEEHGESVIVEVRKRNRVACLRLGLSLVLKQPIEIGPENPFSDLSDAELDRDLACGSLP